MPAHTLEGRVLHFTDHHQVEQTHTLLMIHGAGGSLRVWPPAFYQLPAARVVALDLPGHGRSDPPGRRSTGQYAAVVEAFVAALGLSNLVLIGHSLGSAIALTVALNRAIPLDGLILFGASARMPVGEALLAGSLNSLSQTATFISEQGIVDAPAEYRAGVYRDVLATGGMTTFGDFMACNRFDLRPALSQIDLPALIVAGKLDCMTPLRFSESLAAGLPRSRLAILEGTGHFPMLERTDSVIEIAGDFLRELPARPASEPRL